MFYLELALGVVTKKGVLRCWDLAPQARGIGFAMMVCCVFTALALGAVAAWCLALLVHCFHSFLPWLHCAASATPACAARHRPLQRGSETPAQSFFLYLVLFKDVIAYFVLFCFALGAGRLKGAAAMFRLCDWSVLFDNIQIWRDAVEYSLIEMTVSQGSLIMLGAYCPERHKLGMTALLAFTASKTSSMISAFILGATHGALQADYESNDTSIWRGASASMVLWEDFVARVPGSTVGANYYVFVHWSYTTKDFVGISNPCVRFIHHHWDYYFMYADYVRDEWRLVSGERNGRWLGIAHARFPASDDYHAVLLYLQV
ncbi:unnamed protein product [Diatraea saccharalis]|uniref:Uncharacterized protein n=1 Tax=Diatraea saccharalis TaxID=40085 RepID=A0A9N9WK19_9NEOP|nr:unnamed protein product [Diatraea saccharalis]